jgi:glycerophosphoryl diester phosphodiesterase
MNQPFEIQGHRGARALRPENTLPSFEAALDAGVASIETDLQFTADSDAAIHHDPAPNRLTCSSGWDARRIRELPSALIGRIIVDRNPDPARFPQQSSARTNLSDWFASEHLPELRHPYAIPLLEYLFAFVAEYAGDTGRRFGKSPEQRAHADRVILDLEIKNEPFAAPIPEAVLERLSALIVKWGMAQRCRVRSFDHRLTRRFSQLMPNVAVGILITGTVAINPVSLTRDGGGTIFCPEYRSLDLAQVEHLHDAGIRVLPFTVNDPEAWRRLIDWGVDGITTDDPVALSEFVHGGQHQ